MFVDVRGCSHRLANQSNARLETRDLRPERERGASGSVAFFFAFIVSLKLIIVFPWRLLEIDIVFL